MKGDWEKLEKDTKVNLAKVNDQFVTPEDNIVGFPTIKLLNSNKETVYNSSRDFDSFKKFLEDNVKTPERKTPSPRRSIRRVTRKSIQRTRRPRRAMGPKKRTRRKSRRPSRPKKRRPSRPKKRRPSRPKKRRPSRPKKRTRQRRKSRY